MMGVFRRPYKVRTLTLRNVSASCWHGDVRIMHDVGTPNYQPQLRPRICKDTSIEGSGFGGGAWKGHGWTCVGSTNRGGICIG